MPLADTPVLVIGMSHVAAIAKALTESDRAKIDVVNLTAERRYYDPKEDEILYGPMETWKPKTVFLSVKGNYHSVFGLLEHPTRLAIGDAVRGCVPDSAGRVFVPEDLMRADMRERLETLSFGLLRGLAARFRDARLFHLSSPPPCGDAAHVERHPGVFKAQLHRGVSPMPLRRKLYDIHTDLYREACLAAGVEFVDVPAEAVAADGAMKRDFWNEDPTHGNARYGALVLDQIRAKIGDVA